MEQGTIFLCIILLFFKLKNSFTLKPPTSTVVVCVLNVKTKSKIEINLFKFKISFI